MTRDDLALPEDQFRAIAAGGGGSAIRLLDQVQYAKHMELLNRVLDTAQAAGRRLNPDVGAGYDLLDQAQRSDPEAARAVIGYPAVGAWAIHVLRSFRSVSGPADPGGLCAVAAAAAIRARVAAEIEVPVTDGVVYLPSLGAAAADGETAVVRTTASGTTVISPGRRVDMPWDPYRDEPGWLGLYSLRAGPLRGLIDDVDPFRMPGQEHLASRLPRPEARGWNTVFEATWPLLDQHHSAAAAEIAALARVIVPLATPEEGSRSSSSPETFGAVALSRPPDPATLAVALVHEVQHLKLSALEDIVELTAPEDGRRFYAPWRDDPRPVNGLLQGTYAFLGVTGFWQRQRYLEHGAARTRAHVDFAWGRAAVDRAAQTLLSSGQLTGPGTVFVREIARTVQAWASGPVPQRAQDAARARARRHLSRWRSNNASGQLR